MDPIITPMLIGMGVSAVGTLITELIASGKEEEARKVMNEAAQIFDEVELPKLEQAVAEQVGPTALERITVDPAYKSAQMEALSKLGQISDEGGFTLADKAALNKTLGALSRRDAGARAAIAENMQARGTLGAGAELAQRLAAQQESSQMASERGMDVAAQAQQRALNAIMQRGQMAGQMRGQEYGEQERLAQARDAIERYNAGARTGAQGYNLGLAQQQYENQMGRARARAGAKLGQAGAMMQEGQGTRQAGGAYTAGASKMVEQYYDKKNNNKYASPSGYSLDEHGNPVGENRIGSYTTAGKGRY
jgi:hypothetical protein